MAKYIDVESLVIGYSGHTPDDEFSKGVDFVLDLLDSKPPADVKPVMRGRWVRVSGFFTPGGDSVWRCSECGKGLHVYGIEHGTYGSDVSDGQWLACPNCMAIMEGESDE